MNGIERAAREIQNVSHHLRLTDFTRAMYTAIAFEGVINEGNQENLSSLIKDAVKQDAVVGGNSVKDLLNSGIELLDKDKVGTKISFDFEKVLPGKRNEGERTMTDVGKACHSE